MKTASKKGLLGRQAHLLRLLHPVGMANEYFYNITIGQSLSSIETAGDGNNFPCIPWFEKELT